MPDTSIVGKHRVVSASKLIDTIAESLTEIRRADELTDNDVGGVLHKHRDQAAKYRTGLAEMGVTTFLRGCERWNGRFANDVFELIGMKLVPMSREDVSDQAMSTRLSKLMFEWSIAMEDGKVDEVELARMKRTLIEAAEAIDCKRGAAA